MILRKINDIALDSSLPAMYFCTICAAQIYEVKVKFVIMVVLYSVNNILEIKI